MIAKEMVRPLIIVASALAISGAMIAVYCLLRPLFAARDPLAYPSYILTDQYEQERNNSIGIMSVAVEAYLAANHRLPETIADMEQYFPDEHGHYSPSGKRYKNSHYSVQHYNNMSELHSHVPHLEDYSLVYAIIENPGLMLFSAVFTMSLRASAIHITASMQTNSFSVDGMRR